MASVWRKKVQKRTDLRKHTRVSQPMRPTHVFRRHCFAPLAGAKVRTMERQSAERLAENIQAARVRHHLSVRRAAAATDGLVSPTTWARLEDPNAMEGSSAGRNKLIGVAYALGIEAEEVFKWAGMEYRHLPGDPIPGLGVPGVPEDPADDLDEFLGDYDRPPRAPAAASGQRPRSEIIERLRRLAEEQQQLLRELEGE